MTHEALENLIAQAEADCREVFRQLDETEAYHTGRVIRAFQKYRVAGRHFAPSTGYGFDDIGRDTLSLLFAELLGVEKALVRPQIASGTHALAVCLFGVLRPGDKMLSAAASPYDTMEEVIGLAGEAGNGSLKDYGVDYAQVELKDGKLDLPAIVEALTEDVKLVLIQRSRGYDWRPSLDVADINAAIDAIHARRPDVCVMVDNCLRRIYPAGGAQGGHHGLVADQEHRRRTGAHRWLHRRKGQICGHGGHPAYGPGHWRGGRAPTPPAISPSIRDCSWRRTPWPRR